MNYDERERQRIKDKGGPDPKTNWIHCALETQLKLVIFDRNRVPSKV